MLVLCAIVIGFVPWLVVTSLAPLIYTLWVFRVCTTVGPRGTTAVYPLSKCRSVPRSDFTSISSDKGGRAFVVTKSDKRTVLSATSFSSLSELKEAIGGLVPDPIASTHTVENDKIGVFDRDDYSVTKKVSEVEADTKSKGDASAE